MNNDTDYRIGVKGISFQVSDGEISVIGTVPSSLDFDLKSLMNRWILEKRDMPGFFSALQQRLS